MLDETLRCSVVAPWAARYSEEEIELGGHKIPSGVSPFVSHHPHVFYDILEDVVF